MAVNNIYRASFEFTNAAATGPMFFTAHYRTTNVASPISDAAEGQEIADELRDNGNTSYVNIISTTFTFVGVNVIGINKPLVGTSAASGLAGLLSSEALPMRSSPVVKLLTGLRGRSFRGRMFLMAPPETEQASGVLIGSYVSVIENFFGTIQRLSLGASGNIYDQTIFSPTLSNPPTTFIDNLVSASVVNTVMGSQRSRQEV